jgi:peptidoglycan/xylan/chitin deacetylase (PgdA/CDA1 family)
MRGAGAFRRLATAARRRLARRGVILLYHRVAAPVRDPDRLAVHPARFDEQLRVLSTIVEPLALAEFERRRRAGTLPERAVAVTFDDGYQDNLLQAAPMLARARIPATVFVTTGRTGSARGFWWDELAALLLGGTRRACVLPIALTDGGPTELSFSVDDASALHATLAERLRLAPPAERDAAIERIAEALDRPLPDPEVARACDEEELRALAATPGISLGAHTVTHSVMARQSPETLAWESAESRRRIAEITGMAPSAAFAYPYGANRDISDAAVEAVRAAGYACACANVPDAAWRESDPWRLPRHLVRDWDAATFRAHLERWFQA